MKTKNKYTMGMTLAVLFMLTACNALTVSEAGTGSGETIPQGMGLARIRLNAGEPTQSVRTVVPNIGGYYFTLIFSTPGKTDVKKTLDGNLTLTVFLAPVMWTLEVKGYADSGMSTLKATGSTSVLVTEGTVSNFDVFLTPDFSSGGKGNLSYSIGIPAAVSRTFLTLAPLDAPETSREIDISTSAGGTAFGTLIDLPEGAYLAAIDLYDGANNRAAVWTRVVHIDDGTTISLSPAFTAANFADCPPVVGGSTLSAKLNTALASSSGAYTIVLDGNELDLTSFIPETLTVTGNKDITIIIRGNGKEVQLGSTGSLLTLEAVSGSSLKLILQDLTFRGLSNNNAPIMQVGSRGTLDLRTGSLITGNTSSSDGGVYVDSNGIFTMHGGAVSGNTSSSGGGVYVNSYGTFTMHGGAVSDNITSPSPSPSGRSYSYGGGVYVAGSGTFTMHGGAVSGNTSSSYSPQSYTYSYSYGGGVYVAGSGTFTMHSGAVNGNTSASNPNAVISYSYGGGVYVADNGTFTMHSGAVNDNNASSPDESYSGSGGGVYVAGSGTFIMHGGAVSGNTSSFYGGGVYVDSNGIFTMYGGAVSGNTSGYGGGVDVNGNGTFTMHGGTISGNRADVHGGGLSIGGTFTMHGGTISDNFSYSGGGVAVGGSYGTFTMHGGVVSDNRAYGDFSSGKGGGGVYVYGEGAFAIHGGTVSGNNASYGGGVAVGSGTLRISDGVIYGNSAGTNSNTGSGAALWRHSGVAMYGVFSDNTFTPSGNLDIRNTTIWVINGVLQ
jgi:hypothetical protein